MNLWNVQGYDHCMPYGQYNPLELSPPAPRPFVSSTVPLLWRLFPLQPGYVITVWAVIVLMREKTVKAHAHIDDRGNIVNVFLERTRQSGEEQWSHAMLAFRKSHSEVFFGEITARLSLLFAVVGS